MNKKELRKEFLARREALPIEQIAQRSVEIAANLFAEFSLASVAFLHVFLPINRKKEINTWPIVERLRKEHTNVEIVVPRADLKTGVMESVLLKEDTVLKENDWGIPEPVAGEIIDNARLDVVLAPLLVFDVEGNRIGYGKGFYDRLFGTCRADVQKIGLSLEEPVQKIEADVFDVRLNACVTASGVYRF